MSNDLILNLNKIHTTTLGEERIKRNLSLPDEDVVLWCKNAVIQADLITKRGKNWYVNNKDAIVTINSYSYTVITAHKTKGDKNAERYI